MLAEFELETLRAERELAAREERARALETALDQGEMPPEEETPREEETSREDEAEEPAPARTRLKNRRPRRRRDARLFRRPRGEPPFRRPEDVLDLPSLPLRADTRGHLHVDPNVGETRPGPGPARRFDSIPDGGSGFDPCPIQVPTTRRSGWRRWSPGCSSPSPWMRRGATSSVGFGSVVGGSATGRRTSGGRNIARGSFAPGDCGCSASAGTRTREDDRERREARSVRV